MKRNIPFVLIAFVASLLISSCNAEKSDSPKPDQIENTLKSVSLFKDSVGVDSKQLLADFDLVNEAIAEIGYPDAGYRIWEVKNNDADFRYLIEGYWPDMEMYQKIHDHELYKKAVSVESASFSALKQTWYYRFDSVK